MAKFERLPAGGVMTPGSCFDVSRVSSSCRECGRRDATPCDYVPGLCAGVNASLRVHCLRHAWRNKALRFELQFDAQMRRRRLSKSVRHLDFIPLRLCTHGTLLRGLASCPAARRKAGQQPLPLAQRSLHGHEFCLRKLSGDTDCVHAYK